LVVWWPCVNMALAKSMLTLVALFSRYLQFGKECRLMAHLKRILNRSRGCMLGQLFLECILILLHSLSLPIISWLFSKAYGLERCPIFLFFFGSCLSHNWSRKALWLNHRLKANLLHLYTPIDEFRVLDYFKDVQSDQIILVPI